MRNELVPLLLPCGGIFIGGPDDCEALAYATRMSNQQLEVAVTVVRIVLQKKKECTNEEQEMEASLDDSVTEDFKLKNVGNALAVWHEIEVEEEDEVISAIRSVEGHYDLVMVRERDVGFRGECGAGSDRRYAGIDGFMWRDGVCAGDAAPH